MISPDFWNGKRVFVTGHTGFKGCWLSLWLKDLGAEVFGYALPPNTSQIRFFNLLDRNGILSNSVYNNICDGKALQKALDAASPEFIFHLAAQPLVSEGYTHPIQTFEVNAIGTANLLEACRNTQTAKVFINITTDKVYRNEEWDWPYREIDQLGGSDPYSASKSCSEIISNAFQSSFFAEMGISTGTCRAGNVIGGGDWSDLRLLPDAVRSFYLEEDFLVRNPLSIRPWQHVLECLRGYLMAAQYLSKTKPKVCHHWNFGPSLDMCITVENLLKTLKDIEPELTWLTNTKASFSESKILKLDSSRAQQELNWCSTWDLCTTLEKTWFWYREYFKQANMYEITMSQIREFNETQSQCL